MPPPPSDPPPLRPLAGLALVGTGLGAVLMTAPLPDPPLGAGLVDWWETVGTATATVALLRMVAIILAAWLVAVALVGVVASRSRARSVGLVWRLIAPAMMRHALATSAVVAAVAPAAPVAAATAPADDAPLLHDLGPSPDASASPAPVLVDLGPVDPDQPTPGPVDLTAEGLSQADIWTVEPGDHLWRVAEETLHDRGLSPTDGDIAAYSHRVYQRNRATIGDDPDLIHPGAVLTLP